MSNFQKLFFIHSFLLTLFSLRANLHVNEGCNFSFSSEINVSHYTLNGTLYALNSVTIHTKTLDGKGTIACDKIIIVCDELKFEGTIECNGECTIYVKTPYGMERFSAKGKGEFTIIQTPYDIKHFTKSSLALEAKHELQDKCLSLTSEKMDEEIKLIRHHARVDKIDEINLLTELKGNVQKKLEYHKARLGQTKDTESFKTGVAEAGVGMAVLYAAYLLYKNERALLHKMSKFVNVSPDFIQKSSFMTVFISLFPFAFSYTSFEDSVNPQHQKKYESLSLLNDRLQQALITEYKPEETVIKLSGVQGS